LLILLAVHKKLVLNHLCSTNMPDSWVQEQANRYAKGLVQCLPHTEHLNIVLSSWSMSHRVDLKELMTQHLINVTGRLSIEDVLPICGLGPQKSTNIQIVIQTRQCTAWELKILELLNSRVEKLKMWNLCPGLASETMCQCLEILGTDIKKSAHYKHGPPFGEDSVH